jgi:ABC-type lipoprotein release transport system permease subunit
MAVCGQEQRMRTISGHAADERIARTSDILTEWRGWLPLIGVPLLLSTVILAACLRPVRRAAGVNPIDVLREQ